MAKELPIDTRIVQQLAKATVKNLIDGIVELVTNSDDSYRRLEEQGQEVCGLIEIRVDRRKGGICQHLVVEDYAEGMSRRDLERAIVFGGETSGFELGRSVRGLFGRGLKETIIALGEGVIETIKDGQLSTTRLWFDDKTKKPQYDDLLLCRSEPTAKGNGTRVVITVTNERIRVPGYKTFKKQLSSHYALRDICRSPNRDVCLFFHDITGDFKKRVKLGFSYPDSQKVLKEQRRMPQLGDTIIVTIYETSQQLSSPRNNPYGIAGILIKTRSAILDNRLFRFDTDPAAHYFYGQAICQGLEERLRSGQTEIVNFNRGGLEWRHDYCQSLAATIEDLLEPLVLKKRKALERKPEKQVSASTKRMLRKLRDQLNQLARLELQDLPEVPVDPDPNITCLVIKPAMANIPVDIPRTFSIYAPSEVVHGEGREVLISSDSTDIRPLSSRLKLERHRDFTSNQLWYRYFKVVGATDGAEATVVVRLGSQTALAKVRVAPYKRRKRGKLVGRKGGFIADIVPNELSDPPQRVSYRDGIVTVYTRFPSVTDFIGSGLEGVETPQGQLLLAELVGEAFCRELARRGLELGRWVQVPGAEVDNYNFAVNELQKKYLHLIQETIRRWTRP